MAVLLLSGVATLTHAQVADPELRTSTISDNEVVAPPPPPDFSRITVGDDEEQVPRRRVSTTDPFAAQGIRSGAFDLFPSLELGTLASSNVRRSPTDADADIALTIKPELRLQSDWARHSLSGAASLEAQKFLDNKDIDSLEGDLTAAFRLDIRRTTKADFDLAYGATSTGIGDNELPLTAEGARLDQTMALNGALTHDFGGIEGRLRLGVSRNLFGNVDLSGGGTEDNSDRRYTQVSVAARAALNTGAPLRPFAEVAYEPRFYDDKTDRNGLKRNSQGLRLAIGMTVDDDPLWSGNIAATLEMRDYADNSLGNVLAPGVASTLTWRPTDLTRFEFNAGASLAETVAVDVSATQRWTAGLRVAHALRENVELEAGLRTEFERASGEIDKSVTADLGVNWTLNPFLVWSVGYEGTLFNDSGAGGNYTDHRLLSSIVLRR
jgi:hypothetical protein